MIYNDVIFGSVSPDDINLNLNELYARLGRHELDDEALSAVEKIKKTASCRFAYAVLDVSVEAVYSDFGFLRVKSEALSKVLRGSSRVIFMAVTLGNEVDRLIARTAVRSKSEAFYLDAVSSAYAESLAEHVNSLLAEKFELTRRFSPGYADFPLEAQADILSRLNSQASVGILLTDKHLMLPMKSITALIGIKNERSSHL